MSDAELVTGCRATSLWGEAEAGADVLHSPIEAVRVLGERDEAMVLVELDGGVVDGVHHHQPCGGGLTGSDRSDKAFGQETSSKARALLRCFDGEAGEKDHADG